MTTHDVLRKARAYLLEHGWEREDYGVHGGPRCMMGAVCSAMDDNLIEAESSEAADALVDAVGGYTPGAIPYFNDQPHRTLDEVIAAFDAAIEATAPPKPDESPFTALQDLPADQYVDALSALALIPAEALS